MLRKLCKKIVKISRRGSRESNASSHIDIDRDRCVRKEAISDSVSDFKKAVEEAGVFSTTVNKDTLDEAPFAYKDPKEILEFLPETVEVERFVKPIYNLKGYKGGKAPIGFSLI